MKTREKACGGGDEGVNGVVIISLFLFNGGEGDIQGKYYDSRSEAVVRWDHRIRDSHLCHRRIGVLQASIFILFYFFT